MAGIINGTTSTEAYAIKADESRKAEATRLFDESITHFGKVDIWVNNAGLMLNRLIKDISEGQLEQQLGINLKDVFYSLQEAANSYTKISLRCKL